MDHGNHSNDTHGARSAGLIAASPTASCGIAFMAKASVPGRVKTRLVPPLTVDEAAALNTAFLQDVAEGLQLAACHAEPGTSIFGYAAYCPAGATDFFRHTLPASIGLIDAALANFGDCLLHTIQQILARGHSAAVVLNSDSPTLPTAFLTETAKLLAEPGDRAVIGPSSDGGYYLLGLKSAHRRMFEDIAWSTEHVAEQTLERAREIDLEVHRLPSWYDVDDFESLTRLRAELSDAGELETDRQIGLHGPRHARATAALLRAMRPDGNFGRRGDLVRSGASARLAAQ